MKNLEFQLHRGFYTLCRDYFAKHENCKFQLMTTGIFTNSENRVNKFSI